MDQLPNDKRLFALTLAWTGARPSEVLALVPTSFQRDTGIVAIRTLKRRSFTVRELPLPPDLMQEIDAHFGLTQRQFKRARQITVHIK